MNAPAVAIAVSSTMFTRPIRAAPPKIALLETNSVLGVLVSRSPTLLLSLLHTPMPPSTRYRNATAIIQTKKSATDNTSDTFSTLHGSTRRTCRLARTGPLVRVPTWTLARLGAAMGFSACSGVLARDDRGRSDRSGSSLAMASVLAGDGAGSALVVPPVLEDAAPPEMNRLIRSSMPVGCAADVSDRR